MHGLHGGAAFIILGLRRRRCQRKASRLRVSRAASDRRDSTDGPVAYDATRTAIISMRKLRVLVPVVVAVLLAACTSSPTTTPTTTQTAPAVELSTTPTGWVPVAYGDAQLAIPANWYVLYNTPPCPAGSPPGEMFVNPRPGLFFCPAETSPGPKTTVSLGPPTTRSVTSHGEVINSIPVFPYAAGPRSSYLVPSLDVEITVDGRVGQRVLHTLTRSPRTVALASGSALPAPSSWRSVTFVGLRFSVPSSWSVDRTSVAYGLGAMCRTPGVALGVTGVILSNDLTPFSPGCPTILLSPEQPRNGVQVDSGPHADLPVTLSFPFHCFLHGLSACLATSPAYSILVLGVTVPGRINPVFVSIGLAGNGMVARTILYSLRAA